MRDRGAGLLSGFGRYITFKSAAALCCSCCCCSFSSPPPPRYSHRWCKRPSSSPASLAPALHAPRAPPAPPPPSAPSPSELECASNVQHESRSRLPAPNGSLGQTRGQATCATARWKALSNAMMPVHFARNEMPHNSDSTAKAVGSHSVSNTGHFSVEHRAKTERRVGRIL